MSVSNVSEGGVQGRPSQVTSKMEYGRAPLYGHLINTDNRHLFLAQSTDFHRKPTSLRQTLYYQLCAVTDLSFLKEDKKSLFDVPNFYTTPDRLNCRRQFQTILASNELYRERLTVSVNG